MRIEVTQVPKCTVCGKEVTDIGPLDVPYHVECVMAAWDRALRPPETCQATCSPELTPLPVVMVPVAVLAGRPSSSLINTVSQR
jgi:hypothetical protein